MAIWISEIKELERLYESLKDQLPDLEKELERLIKADDENMILLYSRRCLEVIITDLCECELKRPRKTEPLKGIIDKLHKEQKVPSNIITSMDHLNSLSAYGAHPKNFDSEQVKPVLINLDIIIKWYLKHKEAGKDIEAKLTEEIKQDTERAKEIEKSFIIIPKRRVIGMVSGLILLSVIAIAVLFNTNIIGGGKQSSGLEKSIAVLPFVNDSPDQENTYFINGIMDEILNNLQKIKDFRVLSRTSTEQYRGTNKPTIPKIAKELDVNYIVEGSGQRYGNKFVLRVQLIAANNEKHLWGESFEQEIRETSDIINLQSQIAQKIAAELKTTITPKEKQLIEKFPTQNVKAYDDYLKGYDYYNKGTEEDLLRAIQYYNNAIAYDPKFALAYTGISWAYMSLLFNANWLPEEVYPKARDAALKALEIDNDLSEAHTAISSVILYNDWDINKAEKELNAAIALNPNSPSAYDVYAILLSISCRTKEALEKYKHVLALNPNSEDVKFSYEYYVYQAFKTDSAILSLKKGVENDPNSDGKHYLLGYVYLEKGDYLESILELENAIELNPYPQPYYLYLGIAYNRVGKSNETKRILEKLNTLGGKNNKVAFGKAVLLAELGETDQSIYWLRKAYEERHQFLLYLKSVPIMCSSIRTDPRFIEIYKKIWPDD